MGTADEADVEEGATKGEHPPTKEGHVSDQGGDSDPGAASDEAGGEATGEDQAAENRDRESPS